MLNGVNLAGGEIEWGVGNTTNPTSGKDYLFVTHQDTDYLVLKGMNFFRLIFSWEALQPNLNGPLATNTYANDFWDRVNYITNVKGAYCLIEPHGASSQNFARYKGNLVGSSAVPNSAFADFWGKVATKVLNNTNVFLGLSNEPNNISTVQWFNAAQAAITAIRNVGFNNAIFVPGNGWSGAASWLDTWYDTSSTKVSNATAWKTLKDPVNNLVASVHNYADPDAGGGSTSIVSATVLVDRLTNVVNWAKTNGVKVHMSEFGVAASNSLAQSAVNNVVNYMNSNSSVMVGASWWASGPISWWSGYQFTLCPTNNYSTDSPQMKLLLSSGFIPQALPTPAPAPAPSPTPSPSPYLSVTYDQYGFFRLDSGQSPYIGYKPDIYDESKPISLFVWMHGCGGNAEGDLWNIAPPATRSTQSYIAISLGGRDGACWQTSVDAPKVLAAISDIQKYFNIDKNKIYLGGYSSGGDMTYRVGMQNAGLFAGLLIENSDATGSGVSLSTLMDSASWKINIAQLNHLSDTTYPIDTARASIATLRNNGFPVVAIEKAGTHWDADTATSGTNYDLIHFLLPYLDAWWSLSTATPSPAPAPSPTPAPTPIQVPGITPTSIKVKVPGDQGFASSKVVGDGYAVPAGTYTIKAATRTTYGDNDYVSVDIILSNESSAFDYEWQEMKVDMRAHTLDSFWNCTAAGTAGIITITPTADTKIVRALNKTSIGFSFKRSTDITKAYYQVLIKSIKW